MVVFGLKCRSVVFQIYWEVSVNWFMYVLVVNVDVKYVGGQSMFD